jgi:hypothetical protein
LATKGIRNLISELIKEYNHIFPSGISVVDLNRGVSAASKNLATRRTLESIEKDIGCLLKNKEGEEEGEKRVR